MKVLITLIVLFSCGIVRAQSLPEGFLAPLRPPVSVDVVGPVFESAQDAVNRAIRDVSKHMGASQTLPPTYSWRQWLDPTKLPAIQGMSHGSVADGRLANGIELPVSGRGYQIFERHQTYQTRYGTASLIHIIEEAAKHVEEHAQGASLRVGNLSRPQGGDIRWSRSHNSGRDADLAFYVVDQSGTSIPAPELLQFRADGIPIGRPDLRFDVKRNWLFVRGLLDVEDIQIQFIFISLPLKAMLLDYARATGEPEAVIAKAADVLHQPNDALPHDDHFHLRIACPPTHRVRGCLESGPQWPWGHWSEEHLLAQALSMARVFEEGSEAERVLVLEHLALLQSPFRSDVALIWGVQDPSVAVRSKALAIVDDGWPWSGTALHFAQRFILASNTSDEEKAVAYGILRRSVLPQSRDFALMRLTNRQVPESERVMAARSLLHFMDEDLIPVLINELGTQPPRVAHEIAQVLYRITNRATSIDWRVADITRRDAELLLWQRWMEANFELGREIWVMAGLNALGYAPATLSPENIDELLELLPRAPAHVVYNINRTIREMTGRWAPLEQSDGNRVQAYWKQWWTRNRARQLQGR